MESLMDVCIETAAEAVRLGQVPIAAVVARDDGTVVSRAFNRQALDNDKTAHAEIVALRNAAASIGVDERNLVLASTVEPCVMCTGASMMSGVETVLYGLPAPLDGGSRRVQAPVSPECVSPRFVGKLCVERIEALFATWLQRFPGARGADFARELLAARGRSD
jgi:tRNA(adenine34) deaminase